MTERASHRIAEFAFRYARTRGRKRVTMVHKANIMKLSDGLFLDTARKLPWFPELETQELIVDACAMQLVRFPERFDVLVMDNLYGDILSELCAGLVGGLGMVPGANLGDDYAVFEAVHGSAPDIAGQHTANPTAVILSGALMLSYMGETAAAQKVERAVEHVYAKTDRRTPDLGGTDSTETFARRSFTPWASAPAEAPRDGRIPSSLQGVSKGSSSTTDVRRGTDGTRTPQKVRDNQHAGSGIAQIAESPIQRPCL